MLVVAFVVAAALAAPAHAGKDARLKRIGTFDEPVYVTTPPEAPRTLAVVERRGLIRIVRRGRLRAAPLADLRSRVLVEDPRETIDQRGLFSLAFAPDYRESGRFYVAYVDRQSRMRVDELRRGGGAPRRVLDLGPVPRQHHGGQLQFGPDGLLYVSTGVGDEPEQAQAPDRPGGKILRLDPRAAGPRAELYALGLRNPWRFSFDRRTGILLIGDVGGGHAEEVDLVAAGAPPGANFGFPAFEGRARREPGPPAAATAPELVRTHAGAGWCAITGGYLVRDRRLRRLRGRYVYGDLCSGRIRAARLEDGRLVDDRRARVRVPYLVSFGEAANGRLYAVSFAGGVYRFRRP